MSSQALIDKILKTAEAEAEQITDEILRRAGENEKLILSRAAADCEATAKEAAAKCEQIKRISELTSGLAARKARLHARRELLDEAFGQAYSKVMSLPDEKRRAYILKLIGKYAPAQTVGARVAKRDLPLFDGESFETASADGGKISVSLCADDGIKGGVYMTSADADVDCTIDAIFAELREKYEAEADRMMFSDGNGDV